MVEQLRERAWRFILATFPERQVYIRSDGRVQFFTFNPLMQAIMAGICLLFLGWVAFTSVNTIFKDRIIASKEANFLQMQASYETRFSNLQLSYDQLNGAVVAAEDHFRSIVNDLEARHRTLAGLIRGKENLRAELGLDAQPSAVAGGLPVGPLPAPDMPGSGLAIGGAPDFTVPDAASAFAPPSARDQTLPAPPGAENRLPSPALSPAPSLALPPHTFLQGAVRRLGSLFAGGAPRYANVDHPSLRQIAELEAQVLRLQPIQTRLMEETRDELEREAKQFESTIRTAGLNPNTLVARVEKAQGGMGGPELSLAGPAGRTGDRAFAELALEATASYLDLASIATALRSIPLSEPVLDGDRWLSSGFGTRRDPLTQNLAFHAGLDFSGTTGSEVHVTAPGIVVFAGPRGDYGNTVEVDHGYGIKTRYGHLSKILVRAGTRLERADVVGMLGSTGRSTGPHVHYEVWFDNSVRNPSRFLRAGRDVFKEQGT